MDPDKAENNKGEKIVKTEETVKGGVPN